MEFVQFLQHGFNWVYALVAVVSGAMLLWPFLQTAGGASQEVGTLAATRLINQNALLLDLRESKEYEGGKLPNAMHIPLSQLKERRAELSKYTKRPVVAYCARGAAGRSAGVILKEIGFQDVYQLQGGLLAWKSAGLPIESTS